MSTADLLRFAIACGLACALLDPGMVVAHPVAQGGLDLAFLPDRVSVRVRPSMEEVFVATAFAGRGDRPVPERVRAHSEYLLRHLRLSADGRLVAGRLVRISGEDGVRPEYDL